MFLVVNTLENESSMERKFQGTKVPGPFGSGERAKVPEIELASRFAPASELSRERKGCQSINQSINQSSFISSLLERKPKFTTVIQVALVRKSCA